MIRRNYLSLIFFFSIALLWAGLSAAEQQRFKVRSVSFEGNTAFTAGRLQNLMLTRPSAFLSPTKFYPEIFADDLDNLLMFYRQNGYLDAQIADTLVQVDTLVRRVDISITLSEGPRTFVEGVTIFGNEFFSDSLLRSFIKFQKGDPLRRPFIEDAVASMLSHYAENGFLDASVTPNVGINTETHLAVVDFILKEKSQARIDSIVIAGLEKTKRHVIARELQFSPGETIRYSRLLKSQRRLYLTGLFESIFVRPAPAGADGSAKRNILVEIKEKRSSEFAVSVGYGSIEKIRGRVELSTQNLAGTARQSGIVLEANFIRQGITVSFSEPWTLGSRWQTDLSIYGHLRQEPGYDAATYGGRTTVGRKISGFTTLSLGYRFENTSLSDIKVHEAVESLDPRIRSLTVSLLHDTRDNFFDAQRGWYASWTNELAGSFLQGSDTFARSIIAFKFFQPVGRQAVIGSALEMGWMDSFGESEEIPLNERFYAGGPTTIRGFGYQMAGPRDDAGNPSGGRFKTIWNAIELRRSIYRVVGGTVFLDVGNVWSDIDAFKLNDIRSTIGIGLRVNSPLGIVRLDYGLKLDRRSGEPSGRLFLVMGQAF